MNRLEQLPEVTEHVFSGLKADDSLKHRIIFSAASHEPAGRFSLRTVVALCSLSVLLVLLCVFVVQSKTDGDFQIISAGSRHSSPPVKLENIIEKAVEISNP